MSYEGETKTLVGTDAVKVYLKDNKRRTPGIKRKIYTGKTLHLILFVTPSGKQVFGDIPEFFEEIDFGTGRLFHTLKTALRTPVYKDSRVFGEDYSLEQLIAKMIGQMKETADKQIDEVVDSVVVGRPVVISPDPVRDQAAQNRLEEILKLVGFKKIKFEFEPVAAAKYFVTKNKLEKQKILVFDFGGGTLDTALVEYDQQFKVLATDGVYIGGDLLNSDILYHKLGEYFGSKITWSDRNLGMPTHIIDSLRSWYAIPTLNNPADMAFLTEKGRFNNSDPEAMKRLTYLIQHNLGFEIYEAIEKAKKELTNNESARTVFKDGSIDIDLEINKKEFEKIIKPRVEEIKAVVLDTLKKANLKPEEKITKFDPFTSVAAGFTLE